MSAFAGSPLLVALEPLIARGWLAPISAGECTGFAADHIAYEHVAPWRMTKLRAAHAGFESRATPREREAFAAFQRAQRHWLDDYALFMALDELHRANQVWSWTRWEGGLARREPKALGLEQLFGQQFQRGLTRGRGARVGAAERGGDRVEHHLVNVELCRHRADLLGCLLR